MPSDRPPASPPPHRRARPALLAALGVAGVAGLVVCGGWVALGARAAAVDERAEALIAQREAAYRAGVWSRPVLRGEPIQGNSAEIQHQRAATFAKLGDKLFDGLAKGLASGSGAPVPIVAAAKADAAALAELRRAAQAPSSFTPLDLAKWPATPIPSFVPVMRGWKLLLAQASTEPPAECLRICADVLRLAQDVAPGAGLVGAMVSVTAPPLVAPLALSCAQRADEAARSEASREIGVLVANPPPFAAALETEWLAQLEGLRTLARKGEDGPIGRWTTWGAVDDMVAHPVDGAALAKLPHPELVKRLTAEAVRQEASKNAVINMVQVGVVRYAHKDASAQATLRALAVALVMIGDGPSGPKTRAALESPALRDPFTDKPLHVDPRPGGGVRIISYGADGVPQASRPGSPDDDGWVDVPVAAQ